MKYTETKDIEADASIRSHPSSRADGPFQALLKSKGLWPSDPLKESDWSGRGQHVEFQGSEREAIDALLPVQQLLGSTNTAIVESVRCRRMYLARKTVRCGRSFTKEQAIEEVAHLNKLRHSHIVQIIGTYSIGINSPFCCSPWRSIT